MSHNNLIRTIKNNIVISICILSVLMASLIMLLEFIQYKQDVVQIRERYIEEQKAMIKDRVLEFIDYVEFVKSSSERDMERNLISRVEAAWQSIDYMYKTYKNEMPEETLKELIKNGLRNVRFGSEDHYYFIEDSKGNNVLFAYDLEMEGLNYWDLQDSQGNYTVQEEIHLALAQGAGMVEGYWPKPNDYYGENYLKRTYVKYFEPYDWIIGTGAYLKDSERNAKQEILMRMESIRFGKQGYIFANTYDGIALVLDGQVVTEYKNIWELEDPNGYKVIQAEREAVKNPDGEYIYYVWNKLAEEAAAPKVSFIKGIEDWEWMIGSGVYLDDVELIIADRQSQMVSKFRSTMINISILTLLVLGIIYSITTQMTRRIKHNLLVFTDFFREASEEDKTINLDQVGYEEFEELGIRVNEMVKARADVQSELAKVNENLEIMVSKRTSELESKIEDLGIMQDKLIQKEKMAIVGELVPGFAHDINTPVGVAITANSFVQEKIKMIRSNFEEGKLKRSMIENCLEDISESTSIIENNLRLSAEQIQSFKRLSIDQSIDEFRTFDLVAYIKEISLSLSPLLKSGQHSVEIGAPENLEIVSYPGVYFQVLSNLISNSVVHGFTGREKGVIRIEMSADESNLRIKYSDNGIGIEGKYLDKIFNPYFTTKKHAGGSGIGLNIVYNLISTTLDGSITCESQFGEGTTFFIEVEKHLSERPEVSEYEDLN